LATFSVSQSIHSRYDSLDGGSARRKAPTYTQNNTSTELTHTDIDALSGIRTHDPSVRAGEDDSSLRLRGHCDLLNKDNGRQIRKSGGNVALNKGNHIELWERDKHRSINVYKVE
jgi:hypothetical protein